MRGINKAIIVGTVGQDPEVKFMNNGNAVTNISVATSEKWKDKNTGERKEKTEWHRVVIFGKTAEIAGEYLRKGSQVYIEGQLQTRKWQDQNGQDRYTTEIVVQGYSGVMQMIGKATDVQQAKQQQNNQGFTPQQHQQPQQQQYQPQQQPQEQVPFDDDIPF